MTGTFESVDFLCCLIVENCPCTRTRCFVDFSLEDRQQQRERLREKVLYVIHCYGDEGRPFEKHNSLIPKSLSILSYPISSVVWFQYYRELEAFLRNIDEDGLHRILYIRGTVFIPFNSVLCADLRLAGIDCSVLKALFRVAFHQSHWAEVVICGLNRFRGSDKIQETESD